MDSNAPEKLRPEDYENAALAVLTLSSFRRHTSIATLMVLGVDRRTATRLIDKEIEMRRGAKAIDVH